MAGEQPQQTVADFLGPPPAPDQTVADFLGPPETEQQRYKRINEGVYGAESPIKDWLMSGVSEAAGSVFESAGRIVRAFGHGMNEAGPATGLSPEDRKTLRGWTGYDTWNKRYRDIAKAASNVLLEPWAYDLSLAKRAVTAPWAGAQAAVAQVGQELERVPGMQWLERHMPAARVLAPGEGGAGARTAPQYQWPEFFIERTGQYAPSRLAREVAAAPEAYPTFDFRAGMPARRRSVAELQAQLDIERLQAEIERYKQHGIIGPDGEAGWKGTAPPPSNEPLAKTAAEEKQPPPQNLVNPDDSPRSIREREDAIAAARDRGGPIDLHEAARAIDKAVDAYDYLARRRDTFRQHLAELRDQRDHDYAAAAPNAAEIAELQVRIDNPDTTPRLRKKYQARLGPLQAEHDAYMAERPLGLSPEMKIVQDRIVATDEQMRDFLEDRNAAYREAAARYPELVPKEAEPPVAVPSARAAPVAEVPNSAFNGDLAEMLDRAFYAGDFSRPIPLANVGFSADEITALERAGLATNGEMSPEQYGAYDQERGARVSGRPSPAEAPPAAAAAPTEGVSPETLAEANLPLVRPGFVRFYHGGFAKPEPTESRWVSQQYDYARNYRGANPTWYIDIPENWLRKNVGKAYDDTGTDQVAPYVNFEAPVDVINRAGGWRKVEAKEPARPAEPPPEPPSRAVPPEQVEADRARIARETADAARAAGATAERAEAIGRAEGDRFVAEHAPQAEPRAEAPPERPPEARAEPPARPIEEQRQTIVEDWKRLQMAAGRDEREAQLSAELLAEDFIALAARFKGRLGSAEEIYFRENPEPVAPGRRAVQPQAPRARKAEEKLSLLEFLARRGGLADTAETRGWFPQNHVTGEGRLLRPGGMSLDKARELAGEAGYLAEGHRATTRDLENAIQREMRATRPSERVYRAGEERVPEGPQYAEEEYGGEALEAELARLRAERAAAPGEPVGEPVSLEDTLLQTMPEEAEHEGLIGQRLPTSKKEGGEQPGAHLTISVDALKQTPKLFEQAVNALRPLLPKRFAKAPADEVAEAFVNHVASNLVWLWNKVDPQIRERSKLWYEGGRQIIDNWVADYKIKDTTAAAVLAAMSPQKDWYQNVSLAHRVLEITKGSGHNFYRGFTLDEGMRNAFNARPALAELKPIFDMIDGKSLGDIDAMELPVHERATLKAMWVRLYDEANFSPHHHIITPEGGAGEVALTLGGEPRKIGWGSLTEIAKAIQAIDADGNPAVLEKLLGEKHKVRSFYANLLAPNSRRGAVTIDTHAVAAALLRPLSGKSLEVAHNFANYPGKGKPSVGGSAITGAQGTYAFYADAYRLAAERLGVLPRELQSVTWEAVRGLFAATEKTNLAPQVLAIWKQYNAGKITIGEARRQVLKAAGATRGIPEPTWTGRRGGAFEAREVAADEGELPQAGVYGEPAGRAGAGGRGEPAGVGAEEVEPGELFQERPRAPPFYSAVQRVVSAAKQVKASAQQWLATIRNAPGVKPEEMKWLGLEDWLKEQKGPVTREQLDDYIRANSIEVREVTKGKLLSADQPLRAIWQPEQGYYEIRDQNGQFVTNVMEYTRGGEPPTEETALAVARQRIRQGEVASYQPRYSQYTLPGGENYGELLLTLPLKESARETEIRAQIKAIEERIYAETGPGRLYDRAASADPERNRLYDELQRLTLQRQQQIYRGGHFEEPNILAHVRFNERTIDGKRTLFLEEVQSDWHQAGKRKGYAARGGVPDAPFKTTWPELALKRMIRYAAEHGYDQIGWTTGETQAARYDLSKQVDGVSYAPDTKHLRAFKNGVVVIRQTVEPADLADVIGKEAADKLLKTEIKPSAAVYGGRVENVHELEGVDLKVGGEGMKGFYDQMLPAAANKLTKKFGGKVGRGEVTKNTPGFDVVDSAGNNYATLATREAAERWIEEQSMQALAPEFSVIENKPETEPVHTLPITEKMEDAAIEEGFPLFQTKRGGIVLNPMRAPARNYIGRFLGVTDVRPILRYYRDADHSTVIHELGHYFLAQLLRYSEHELAPEDLKADAQATLRWLGVKRVEDLTTAHHEQFAKAFERYLSEGSAPSPQLANVFAQFREWILEVYKKVRNFGYPVNDEIRGVFDRMLAEEPVRQPVIVPERPRAPGLGDIHEGDLAATAREHPAEDRAGDVIQSERDIHAGRNLAEEENADRLRDVEPQTASRAPGAEEPRRHGAEGEPGAGRGYPGAGAELPGGGEAAAPGAPALPRRAGREGPGVESEPPAGENENIERPSQYEDKAGNIRLDKYNSPEDVKDYMRDVSARNNQFQAQRRGVLGFKETLDLATALGMDPSWLDRWSIGQAFNVEQIRAARRLLVTSATHVLDLMAAAKGGDLEALGKLAEGIARHEMIQGTVSGVTAEAGRALAAFREQIGGWESVEQLNAFLKANTGRDFGQLNQMAQYGSNLKKPSWVSRLINDTQMMGIGQTVKWYYVNTLISGPVTHLRYMIGNALTALFKPIFVTPTAAGLSAVESMFRNVPAAERVRVGEAWAELYALTYGSRIGLQAALEGFREGTTPTLPELQASMFARPPVMPPVGGIVGQVIGFPGRFVGGIHGFFSTLRYVQEIAARSWRQATAEGLTGDAFRNRLAELQNRPTADMMEAAAKRAMKDLYMAPTDYHSFQAKLARLADHNVATRTIMPFVKIGAQITGRAVEMTPLGLLQQEARENIMGRHGIAAQDQQLALMTAGTALFGTMILATLEGNATGDGPSDPQRNATWRMTHKPTSITIGNMQVPYQRLGALGMLMRTAANMTEAVRGWGEDAGEAMAGELFFGFERAVLGESFMTGVKDLLDATYHHEEYGQRYWAQMLTNWTPYSIASGQIAGLVDPVQRETRPGRHIDPQTGKVRDSAYWDAVWNNLLAKTPLVSERLMPKRDLFGAPVKRGGNEELYRNDRTAQTLDRLGIKSSRYEWKIRGVPLTDQQHDDFMRIGGAMTKLLLDGLIQPGFEQLPLGIQIEQAKRMIDAGRKWGEDQVSMSSIGTANDIPAQALADKMSIKLTGKKAPVQ